jgi:Tol biopolymer transport system component
VEEIDLKGNPACWRLPGADPAGGRLAFTLKDGDKSSLAVYNLENGETDNLELAGSRPVWSPDGNRIGYLAARETDSGQVVEVFVTDDFGADQWKAFEWDSAPQVNGCRTASTC